MSGAAGLRQSWTAIVSGAWRRPRELAWPVPYIASAGLIALATAAAFVANQYGLKHVSAPLLAAVTLNAILWGVTPSLLSAVLCVAIEIGLFYAPNYDPGVVALDGLVDLVGFSVLAVIVSDLVAQLRAHASDAEQRERATADLNAFSRKLGGIADAGGLYLAAIEHLEQQTGRGILLFLPDRGDLVVLAGRMHDRMVPEPVQARARALWNDRAALAEDDEIEVDGWRLRALRTWRGPIALVGIAGGELPEDTAGALSPLLDLIAVAIERTLLARAIEDTRVKEARDRLHEALINSVSHSLQTPLAVIIGSATSLQGFASLHAGKAEAELVATIREEAERLERVVGKILQMTRIRAGAIAPKLELVELPDIVNSALRRVRRAVSGHAITLELPRDLPMMRLDLFLMEEALANLLENAAKYAPRGTRIGVSATVDGGRLLVDVADQGPGIPVAALSQVFEPFFRAGAPDSSPPGTGLGLAICRAFVEANGGTVAVATAGPAGTVFRVSLPIPRDALADAEPGEIAFSEASGG
ncbi:MAG: DUF4118 domain-containing protein [Alphaproteobacteria bacterium]|nr:DUF4118 domain-containing protein [Alphaproteobacteria bacterium]